MQIIYQTIILAILFSGIASGFITFRMSGMRLAPHFGAMIFALIVTLAGIATGNILVIYAAAALQLIAAITAFTQTWAVLKYNFQTSPAYAPHLALMGMLPVLTVASVL
ncbi:MAG: DUF5400 domain-containing protein [Methanobacterium sp.]|jgi:glucose dehydrogenase